MSRSPAFLAAFFSDAGLVAVAVAMLVRMGRGSYSSRRSSMWWHRAALLPLPPCCHGSSSPAYCGVSARFNGAQVNTDVFEATSSPVLSLTVLVVFVTRRRKAPRGSTTTSVALLLLANMAAVGFNMFG